MALNAWTDSLDVNAAISESNLIGQLACSNATDVLLDPLNQLVRLERLSDVVDGTHLHALFEPSPWYRWSRAACAAISENIHRTRGGKRSANTL